MSPLDGYFVIQPEDLVWRRTRPGAILSYRPQAAAQGIERISLAVLRLKLTSLIRLPRVD